MLSIPVPPKKKILQNQVLKAYFLFSELVLYSRYEGTVSCLKQLNMFYSDTQKKKDWSLIRASER